MIFGKYAAVGGALALGVLWPFATGQIAQVFYEREMGLIQSPYFDIRAVDYDRGYLSSNITTELVFKKEWLNARIKHGQPASFLVNTKLKHGFLSVQGQSNLQISENNRAMLQTLWANDLSPLTFDFTTTFLGNTDFSLQISPMQSNAQNVQIKSASAILKGKVEANGVLSYQFMLPKLSIENEKDNFALNIDKMNIMGEGELQNRFWFGTQQLQFEKLFMQNPIRGSWQILNSSLAFANTLKLPFKEEENQALWRIDTQSSMTAEQITNTQNLQTARALSIALKLSNVDYQSLITLANLQGERSAFDLEKTQLALNTIIERGLSLSLPMNVDIEQGSVNGVLNLTIAEGDDMPVQTLDSLLNKLRGDMKLAFPNDVINTQVPLYAILMQQGFITHRQNDAELGFSLEGDEIISASGTRISYKAFLPQN